MNHDDVDTIMLTLTALWPEPMGEPEATLWSEKMIPMDFEISYKALEEFEHAGWKFRPKFPEFLKTYERKRHLANEEARKAHSDTRGITEGSQASDREISLSGLAKCRETLAAIPKRRVG